MPYYRISESVSGETKIIKALGPVQALIKYLQTERVNIASKNWNWDFEVKWVRATPEKTGTG